MWDWLFGKDEKMQQASTMTGGQSELLEKLLGQMSGGGTGMEYLQNILSGDTSQFEQPLMRQFHQQTIPGLAQRFSGAGAGAQSSSAFQQALGGAGAGLSENLGALRGNLQMQAANTMQGTLGNLLGQRSFPNIFRPSSPGIFGSMMPGIGSGIGTGGTMGILKLLGLL